MGYWKSEEAEKRFAEVMHRALTDAPQTVLGPERAAVVVMSEAHHHRLVLASQRLLALGEDLPALLELQEGEQNAWEFIESLVPVDELGEPCFPEGFFDKMKEEARHCACCARRAAGDLTSHAAD
ncbi:MAG TPA: hypothetical protein VF705_06595 [Longimicrobium sp.]|jgi:hypothetical protein